MILVTGASGFIGSRLVTKLAASGKQVRALYRRQIPSRLESTRGKVEWFQSDILDITTLDQAYEGVDEVYHCAGLVSFISHDRIALMKTNVEGTANMVNLALAHGIRKLVHVSSVAAIGRPLSGQTIDESLNWEDSPNNTLYALSKHLGEMEVWRGVGEGLNAVIVNPSIVLGPIHGGEAAESLFRLAYREFPWFTVGVNGFVDLEDVCSAMELLMESRLTSRRFILNSDNWSYRELFSALAACMGKRPPYREASAWMTALLWRAKAVKSFFTGIPTAITRQTSQTALLQVYYDNRRILEALPGFRFTPLEQTIPLACKSFLDLQSTLKV